MNKGFEEIYEGMRVNRENFCLECVFISEIELAHFRTCLEFNNPISLVKKIAELSDDYLVYTGRYIRIFPGRHNEALAI